MGLGRLNPATGCNPNPCVECKDCRLYLSNCNVCWDCDLPDIIVNGYYPYLGGTFVHSNEPRGCHEALDGSYWRIIRYINGFPVVLAELVVGTLPLSCCREEGGEPRCYLAYPNLVGMQVSVSGLGGIFSELNGLYILSQDYLSYRFASTRFRDPTGTVVRVNGSNPCPGNSAVVPGLSFEIPYNYSNNCPRVGRIPASEIYYHVGFNVNVKNYPPGILGPRCSQTITAGPVIRATSVNYPDHLEYRLVCGSGGGGPVISDQLIGCNDPAGSPIDLNMAADPEVAEMLAWYNEGLFADCWARSSCCGGGGIF